MLFCYSNSVFESGEGEKHNKENRYVSVGQKLHHSCEVGLTTTTSTSLLVRVWFKTNFFYGVWTMLRYYAQVRNT
ncbi:hypothetical protein RIF29_05269 [Crotalaria pallida]|uniref:Uncharacterized protein n=1 Tax=Crotalaria pallida TaxID=3830 RepID=A0AAN9J4E9_CROPI